MKDYSGEGCPVVWKAVAVGCYVLLGFVVELTAVGRTLQKKQKHKTLVYLCKNTPL